jgi:L,D-transpeptidase YbiS
MPKRVILIIGLGVLIIFLVFEFTGYYIGIRRNSKWKSAVTEKKIEVKSLKEIQAKNKILAKKIKSLSPKGVYIVIDTANNILYLRKGNEVILEAVISSGSGDILQEPGGKRKWIFDTPRGEFYVKSKLTEPDWVKPDWAFIEEGENIPKDFNQRIESGVLGDYGLGFGEGYFIHGTLYTRLLGRNVTHGCIRVADNDLKAVYRASSIGTKIFIY